MQRACADLTVIRLRNCPFDHLARRHRDLVCGMNMSLIGGMVPGPAPARTCSQFWIHSPAIAAWLSKSTRNQPKWGESRSSEKAYPAAANRERCPALCRHGSRRSAPRPTSWRRSESTSPVRSCGRPQAGWRAPTRSCSTPRSLRLTTFPNDEGYDELVLARAIPFQTVCEHHLLPFSGVAHVGYLPGERILGLSKLARLVHHFAARPQTQERLTKQVADCLISPPAGPGGGRRARGRALMHDPARSACPRREAPSPPRS